MLTTKRQPVTVGGNTPDFWLNVQRRGDAWAVMHSPRERERIERAKPSIRTLK